MLDIRNLTFGYRRNHKVLDNLSLQIGAGGIYGLLGRNGAGKSTLLYLIAGLLTPDSGSVEFNGADTRKRKPLTLSDTFIVPEEFVLPPIPLSQYLRLNSGFYPNFSNEDLRRNLETFELEPDINLGQLSMGQKKKAFMSFALACNTPLLLLDEPTNGLDIPGKSRFRKFIVSSMSDERTIIISTHQVLDIDKVLDHVIVTERNKVLLDSSVARIIETLKFLNTDNDRLIEQALYARSSINGSDIILPNSDDSDTQLNLETLFEFALGNPEKLSQLFTPRKTQNQ